MANEEVVFAMGLDASGFHNGVQRVKGLVNGMKEDARGLGESFKEALAGFGAAFGIAEIARGGREILEFAENIKNMSEEIGVSTDLLQQFNYAANMTGSDSAKAEKGLAFLSKTIGQAKEGMQGAKDKFVAWNISLVDSEGKARSVAAILGDISQRMNDITDPTERAAMAADLFSKSGVSLVNAIKDLDELKARSGGLIVSKEDLKDLDDANQKLKTLGEATKVLGARALVGLGLMVHPFANRAAAAEMVAHTKRIRAGDWTKEESEAEAERERKALFGDDNKGFKPVDVVKARAMAAAIVELNKAKDAGRTAGMKTQDKVNELVREDLELKRQIAMSEDGSIEKVKLQTQEQLKKNDLLKEEAKLADENQKKLEKEAEFQKKIADAERDLAFAKQQRNESVYNELKPSIEQVAQSGFWGRQMRNGSGPMVWHQSPYAQQAKDIENLEGQARNAYAWGNEDLGNQLTDKRNALRQNLEKHGVIATDRHIERMDENILKLTEAATNAGIKIIPKMAE